MVEVRARVDRHALQQGTRASRLRHLARPLGVLGPVTLLLADEPTARVPVGAPNAGWLFGPSLGAACGGRP
jgi:hypothetical protein